VKARVTVTLKTGILDPQGKAIEGALKSLGVDGVASVRQGKVFDIEMAGSDRVKAEAALKAAADKLLVKLAPNDHLLELATQLEEVALSDDYFISRKLYPNVDFYTGLIYRAMGFPTEMFTVLFAIGRLPGWLAHYKEMLHDPATKIARPRQVYTGPVERDFVAMEKR